MRKSEFIVIAAAVLVASCSFYNYEQDREHHQPVQVQEQVLEKRAKPVGISPNFAAIKDTNVKKQAFFDYLKPGISLENKRIQKERAKLKVIEQSFNTNSLNSDMRSYAQRLGRLYNVVLTDKGINQNWLDAMLHHVDVLPEGLVLVQAANESAWGTSRFATQANNYFGQWCYNKGCGLVPLNRVEGMTHEVAVFSSIQQSIHSYFMNVNRNKAYAELRDIRYQRRLTGQSLMDTEAAMALTTGLLKYSERGEAYVNDIQNMIRHNVKFWERPSL